jgi:hypothetical protein
MKPTLRRLLGIRELVEDLARLELAGRTAAMRALEEAAERQLQMRRSMQAGAIEDLTAGTEAGREAWLLKSVDSEIAACKKARIELLAEQARPPLERSREGLLAKRLERRQVEILHAAEVQEEEKRRIRHDQNRTDDWFQSRPASLHRTRR